MIKGTRIPRMPGSNEKSTASNLTELIPDAGTMLQNSRYVVEIQFGIGNANDAKRKAMGTRVSVRRAARPHAIIDTDCSHVTHLSEGLAVRTRSDRRVIHDPSPSNAPSNASQRTIVTLRKATWLENNSYLYDAVIGWRMLPLDACRVDDASRLWSFAFLPFWISMFTSVSVLFRHKLHDALFSISSIARQFA